MNEEKKVVTEKHLVAAQQDLEDIRLLRETKSFDRYFMRRIRQKKDEFLSGAIDGDNTINLQEREFSRRMMMEFKKLEDMLNVDERSARSTIGNDRPAPNPSAPLAGYG